MAKKLYVGNLSYSTHDEDLREAFSKIGEVLSVTLITDQATGRSKGFGFVEMDTDAQAQAAIQGLNDHEHDGRRLTVNEAKPREERGGGGGRRRSAACARARAAKWRTGPARAPERTGLRRRPTGAARSGPRPGTCRWATPPSP